MKQIKKLWHYPISGRELYRVVFIIALIQSFLDTTTLPPSIITKFFHLLGVGSVVFGMVFKIYVLDEWRPLQYVLITLILGAFAISFLKTGLGGILLYPLLVLGAKGINFNLVIKDFFRISLVALSIVMALAMLGGITNLVYHPIDRATRYSLGITYPTDLAAHSLLLLLSYYYLRYRRIRVVELIAGLLIGILVYKLTDARLDFVATILAIGLIAASQWMVKNQRLVRLHAFMWITTPFIAGVTWFSAFFYNYHIKLASRLNDLLSNRLYLSKQGFDKYNILMFGQKIKEHGYGGLKGMKLFNGKTNIEYFFLDSSYIRLILIYGLIIFLMVILAMTLVSIKGYMANDYILCVIILVLSVTGMVEQHLIELVYNPFLIALMATIGSKQNEKIQFK
ncbi:hypothetical protein [Limosilactobacillus equigenerosi]|uniref:hypothetical protein n=1 Tax=Limosilactobacillus equigenerosi TaxID=417373 RepID=UPI000704D4E4|nr:hypothetical protein [Limosilactobacillus equigenerosi]